MAAASLPAAAVLAPSAHAARTSCDTPPSLIATLGAKGAWTYRVSRHVTLAAGRYRVTTYGKSRAGAFGNSAPLRARVVTFRVSQH
jgi:hypothetical protein